MYTRNSEYMQGIKFNLSRTAHELCQYKNNFCHTFIIFFVLKIFRKIPSRIRQVRLPKKRTTHRDHSWANQRVLIIE